ncbi:hypothetical protein PFISCL1PPCAC_5819 [Pristionchus fissidentatus]|uniref:Folliculin n=1 Tax=Pristionchus fissidentatus TaxID=1538716 RepID=A0AAV5V6Z5_9BILA|nr:hypothetical protein PFISCL1PPCAC_5819 [Pristionchus fissidentatus]
MQAVIAFCHFCESHGPRVIFTTQPLRSLPFGEGPSDAQDWPNESSLSYIANNLPVSEVDYPELLKGVAKDRETRCTACTSIGDRIAYLSADKRTQTTFVSSQVSFDDGVLDKVKYACLRSLTIEVGTSTDKKIKPPPKPGTETPSTSNTKGTERDGNVFFGDAQHGYTMSLTFRLDDSRARGFLRLYSLIVVSSQMQFILNNHDSLLAHLVHMKNRLQRGASRIFQQEMAGEGSTTDSVRPENAPRANMMPQGWFRRRMNVEPSRDLRTIVGDENVWKSLHRQMLWTLRSESLRLFDGALEGLPTQDMLVIGELEADRVAELSLGSVNEHEKTLDQLENLRRIASELEEMKDDSLDRLLYHTITGGQIVIVGNSRSSIRAFLLALSNLLPIGCLRVNSGASQYAHPAKYNLLGLPKGTEIPEWADCIVIQMEGEDSSIESESLEGICLSMIRRPSSPLPIPLPSLLIRYKQLVVDEGVTENVLEATIRSTRDQWLAKTKILFQLMRQPTQYNVNKMLISSRASSRDRDVLFFWIEGLSKAYRSLSCPSSPR